MNENELKLLREMLPRGSRGMIKSNTTFSYSYIDQVLKGKRHNLVIMNKALGIARKLMLSKKMTSIKFQEIMAMLNGAQTPPLPQTPDTPTT